MKKIFLFLVIFVQINTSVHGQNEFNIWYFGGNAGLDFNSGTPALLTNGALNTSEGCATVSNSSGQLLFYTDGLNVWNANHVVMPNGSGLAGNPSSTQSAIIVPKPGSATIYYIFTSDGINARYSEVNMALASGLGDVTSVKNIFLASNVHEMVTAVKHVNNADYWVIFRVYNSNQYKVFSTTSAGVNTSAVTSSAGTISSTCNIGTLKANYAGNRLAATLECNSCIDLLDFNNSTGVISNPLVLSFSSFVYASEFSPNGNLLYVSHDAGSPNELQQYDITSGNISTILSTKVILGTDPNNYFGTIQNAPDGKIYVARDGVQSLAVINSPNIAGSGCGFTLNGFSLSPSTSYFGLPNHIFSLISSVQIIALNGCLGGVIPFSISDAQIDTIAWNFGDPSSGSSNFSNLLNPTHQFSSTGTFSISAAATTNGSVTTYSAVVQVNGPPQINLGNDTVFCNLTSINLTPTGTYSGSTLLWNDNSSGNSLVASSPGTYWVNATNACGSDIDSVIISVDNSLPNFTLGNDTMICKDKSFVITPFGDFNNGTFLWNDGSNSSSLTTSSAGIYWLTVNTACGAMSDTIGITNFDCEIEIPNVLTLNNDNINEIFIIKNLLFNDGELKIFNRWGNLIYENKSYANNWAPKNISDGVYFYIFYYPWSQNTYKAVS